LTNTLHGKLPLAFIYNSGYYYLGLPKFIIRAYLFIKQNIKEYINPLTIFIFGGQVMQTQRPWQTSNFNTEGMP